MQRDEELYQIAGEMRAIAGEGLLFSDNGYHKERYEHLMNLAARLLSTVETETPDRIQAHLLDNLWHLCPLIGVEAAVFRENRLLLVQLREDGLWVLPGGLCEVGEKLAAAAMRELWEEAGVHDRIRQLLAVFDSRVWQTPTKSHLIHVIFLAEGLDGPFVQTEPGGMIGPLAETLQVGFFSESELPPLSQGHHLRVPLLFKLHRGEIPVPYFD